MRKYKKIAMATATFVFVNIVGGLYVWQAQRRYEMERRNDNLEIAASYAYSIKSQLSRSLSATYALATLIQIYGKIDNFETLAESIIHRYGGISCLQLAPRGIVKEIHPLQGNEKALGHNLLQDPVRRTEAFKAIESKKLTLAGPFELIQGGIAVIGRLPVFLEDENGQEKFWGFTIVLIRLSALLQETNIHSLINKGYEYELSRADPDSGKRLVFAKSDDVQIDSSATSFSFNIPNGEWTLTIVNKNTIHIEYYFYLSLLMVFLFGLSFGYLKFSLLARAEEIKSKSIELELSNEELKKMLAEIKTLKGIIPICSFCKKIRDDEGFWNQVEVYFKKRSEADFSHGICPECLQQNYPEEWAAMESTSKFGTK